MTAIMRVREHEEFIRDPQTLAILNTNREALSRHEVKMRRLEKERQQEEELQEIRKDLSELKDLMYQFLNKK